MSDHDRLQELLLEWEVRCERGEDPPAAELCRSCPDLAGPLEAEIAKLRAWRRAAAAPAGTPEWQSPPESSGDAPAAAPGPPLPTAAFDGRRFRPTAYVTSGGMGDVFKANDGEFGREVALKCIRDDRADDEAAQDRFEREAEITGRLEHPGIVPIYSKGRDAAGRPYYGMRFVRGRTFEDAVAAFQALPPGRDRDLALRQLLTRFVAVCQTVAYAHSRGVIHRDLKPQNIMLGPYGETLVLDWGLAKVVGRAGPHRTDAETTMPPPSSGDTAEATLTGHAIGTPAYMSPEQANGQWDDVDQATDVFALGAVLYRLLTGRPPYQGKNAKRDARECEFPPPRAVRPHVPAALAAVCLKAMARKPKDRYTTAQELAADVERWLADEPVAAWREPLGARARRWVRKHARLATGMGAALAVSMAGLGALAWQREHARAAVAAEQAETIKERDRALVARKRTREALDAMVSDVTGDSLTTQTEISDEQKKFLRNVLSYYEEFASEPGEGREGRERLAKAHYRLGMIRYRLGQREEGAAVFARAAELYAGLAADFSDVPDYRQGLAVSRTNLGQLLADLRRLPEAEAEFRRAVELDERLAADFPDVPDYRQGLAASCTHLGVLLRDLGKLPEAEAEFRRAVQLLEQLVAGFPTVARYRQDLADSRTNLGAALRDLGKLSEAEAEFRRAVELKERLAADFPAVPEYRRGVALSRNDLGVLLSDLGKLPEAEAEYRRAIELQEKLVANAPAVPNYRRELAQGRANLGVLLRGLGKLPEAEAEYRRAIELMERLAADFPAVPEYRNILGGSRSNLGVLLRGLGRLPEAEAEFLKAIELREKLVAQFPAVPEYRSDLAGSRSNLGIVLAGLGRLPEAEAEFLKAIELREKLVAQFPAVPEYRSDLAGSRTHLGNHLAHLGRWPEAEAEFRRACELQAKLAADFPGEPNYVVELSGSYCNFGNLFRKRGELGNALTWHTKAIERLTPVVAAEPRLVTARQLLSSCHWGRALDLMLLRRCAEALPDWERALELDDGSYRDGLRLGRAGCLARLGRAAEAVQGAAALAAMRRATADTLYDCACVFALASSATNNPDADAHAARAVALLRQAFVKGYANVQHMLQDSDLDPLRRRADYADLLWGVADGVAR
jgi:serine/threonine-protein kinase